MVIKNIFNRSQFFRGQVDKYTWQSIGSSYLPSEITAAFLLSQLERSKEITQKRLDIWNTYHDALGELEEKGFIKRPSIPKECQHNAHMYYIILNEKINRDTLISKLKENGIQCTYHYIPLHSSPAGQKYGRTSGTMKHTDDLSRRIVRLPLWTGLNSENLDFTITTIRNNLDRA